MDLIFDEWPYVTSPAGQTCALTYVLNVPAAITSSVFTTPASRLFDVGGVIGSAGTYQLTATAVSPDGTAIADLVYTINLTIKSRCDPPGTVTAPPL